MGHIQAAVANIDVLLSDTTYSYYFEDSKLYRNLQTHFDRDRDYPDEPKQDFQSYSNSGYPGDPDHSSTKKDKLPILPITCELLAKPQFVR